MAVFSNCAFSILAAFIVFVAIVRVARVHILRIVTLFVFAVWAILTVLFARLACLVEDLLDQVRLDGLTDRADFARSVV